MYKIALGNFFTYKGDYGVSIANSQPQGYDWPVYKPLQPGFKLVNKWKQDHDNEYYMIKYAEILSKLDAERVYWDLCQLANGDKCDVDKDTPVLLCWCPKGTFCHRYLVAEWMKREFARR